MKSTLYTHTVFSTGPRRVKLVHVKQGVFRQILRMQIAIRYQTAQDRAIFRRPGFPMLAMPRLIVRASPLAFPTVDRCSLLLSAALF